MIDLKGKANTAQFLQKGFKYIPYKGKSKFRPAQSFNNYLRKMGV